MYLIYSWTDLKPGCEFTDCIYFLHFFQPLIINYFVSIPSSWLCIQFLISVDLDTLSRKLA